jgi:hypothetical protein
MQTARMEACVIAAFVALVGCGSSEKEAAAHGAYAADMGSALSSFGGSYISIHGYRSVPADPKYTCVNEFQACLAMDRDGKTPAVETLCPSANTPQGTWSFEYQLWTDPYCSVPMQNVACAKHEGEWLDPGKNTNRVECGEQTADKDFDVDFQPVYPVFLLLDDDAIDNGGPYFDSDGSVRYFSTADVNDDIADDFQRYELRYFAYHKAVGKIIHLVSGEVGDEGWFALKRVPYGWHSDWKLGLKRYLWEPFTLHDGYLDEVPFVTPLRGRGLAALKGKTVCALVYDSDISVNYDPLYGNLQGDTLGLVAFDVLDAERLYGYSSGSLPKVKIRIRDAMSVCRGELSLFRDAPEPWSSSVPYDLDPWSTHDDHGYDFVIR